jgi:hypothetical protein
MLTARSDMCVTSVFLPRNAFLYADEVNISKSENKTPPIFSLLKDLEKNMHTIYTIKFFMYLYLNIKWKSHHMNRLSSSKISESPMRPCMLKYSNHHLNTSLRRYNLFLIRFIHIIIPLKMKCLSFQQSVLFPFYLKKCFGT